MIYDKIDPDFMSEMMKIAKDESKNSPCKRLKVGAVAVELTTGMLLSCDHNRPPKGFIHECLETGCVDINHAELNVLVKAIKQGYMNIGIYITHEPCTYCSKIMIESGIKLIVFEQFYQSKSGFGGGHKLLEKSDIKIIHYINK